MKNFILKIRLYSFINQLVFAYPVYFLMFSENGLSNFQIGVLLSAWALSALLLEVPLGVVADKYDRKSVLIAGSLIKSFVFVVWLLQPSFGGYLAGFILWGLSGALISGTFQAFVYDELAKYGSEEQYEKILGSLTSLSNFGVAIALLLGGWLSEFGFDKVLILSSISSLIAVLILALIKPAGKNIPSEEADFYSDLKSILPEIKKNRILLMYVLISITFLGVYGALDEFYPKFYSDLGVSRSIIGVLGMIGYSFAALGGWLMTRDTIRKRYSLVASIFVALIVYSGVYLTESIFFIILLFPLATVYMMSTVFLNARIQEKFKSSVRATSLSIINMFTEIFVIIITLILGFITTDTMWNMFSLAAVSTIIVFLLTIGSRFYLRKEDLSS